MSPDNLNVCTSKISQLEDLIPPNRIDFKIGVEFKVERVEFSFYVVELK